jgi:hypothetical protein
LALDDRVLDIERAGAGKTGRAHRRAQGGIGRKFGEGGG